MSGAPLRNGRALALVEVPEMALADFQRWLADGVAGGQRIASYFGMAEAAAGPPGEPPALFAVLADDAGGRLQVARARAAGRMVSIAREVPQAQLFEREIAEQLGVVFDGHPWPKPVRFPAAVPGLQDFYRVEGEEVHEVAVGPVHAGVIEPGHFRFQCHGEDVFHLEIALGYQHRGVERAMVGGPTKRSVHYAETVAGDTTVGHTLAYAHAVEALAGAAAPPRAQAIRGLALELERLANHAGDLGALAGDVAYLPTASFCGRLRGDFLNLTAELCGSRFGRSLVRPGGVVFDVPAGKTAALKSRLLAARRDTAQAVELLWDTPSVVERFENTGRVSPEDALAAGLVGPAARACGLPRDVRHDHPLGIYRFVHLPVMTAHHGDVSSRATVRWLEIQQSTAFLLKQLDGLPDGTTRAEFGPLRPDALAVALVEGWRGEICHTAITDASGRFARYKVVDPSFHNWTGLALALRDGQISDFPLCNKSFNLSYCGHDL